MTITLAHNDKCHIWQTALATPRKVLVEENIAVEVEVVNVVIQEDAERYHFLGSPTILINGIDVDPRARKMTRYSPAGCRMYLSEGETLEYPPSALLRAALKELA